MSYPDPYYVFNDNKNRTMIVFQDLKTWCHGPERRQGLTRVLTHAFFCVLYIQYQKISISSLICQKIAAEQLQTRASGTVLQGKVAWTVNYNANLTRLGHSPPAGHWRFSVMDHLSSLRPHWSRPVAFVKFVASSCPDLDQTQGLFNDICGCQVKRHFS